MKETGTKAILAKRKHRKSKILILANKGKCQFILGAGAGGVGGKQGNRYPPWEGLKYGRVKMEEQKQNKSPIVSHMCIYSVKTTYSRTTGL